jgi:predicted alpha/beta hydrolase
LGSTDGGTSVTKIFVLMAASVIFVSGIAHADETSNDLSAAIAFIGTSTGQGTFETNALSISIGGGAVGFTGGAWANGASVATGVGSEGAELLGPPDSAGYEANVCISLEYCSRLPD